MFKKSYLQILFICFFVISAYSVLIFASSININNNITSTKQINYNSRKQVSSVTEVKITNNPKYGEILTDGTGMSLYFFANDKDTVTSACTGGCTTIWPTFYADSLTIGAGLDPKDFGKITRPDSTLQITYKGWPLYYYSGDNTAGDVNGEGFKGIWFVAKPNYTIMLMNNQLVGGDGVDYNSSYQPGMETVQYFVDAYGRTLYYFTKDTFDKNNFTKSDFSNNTLWAIYEDSLQAVPIGVDSSNFGMINVYGRKQLTYKGWPLYEFGPDSLKRGSTKGVSFPSPGIWPVAQTSIKSAIMVSEVKITNNPKYGEILTDGTGRSLYFFANDKDTVTSACTGGCTTIWPTFYADSLTIGAGLDPKDFGKITRPDSTLQITYKGWPLYYYSGDYAAGDVNGEGFKGIWFVAKPNYTIMLMNNQLVGGDGVDYNSSYQPGMETVQYFVDAYGRTLYYFTKDTFDKNNFTKSDFSNNTLWAVYEDSLQAVPIGVDSSNFGMIDVYGRKQLTYKGWPLYEFGPDSLKRGSTKGVSFPSPGIWPVAQTSIDSAVVTGINGNNFTSGIPKGFSLSQNYPDPFNPSTMISYSLPVQSFVTLKVYNIQGEQVATLVSGTEKAGRYTINFNANKLSSGVYFYNLRTFSTSNHSVAFSQTKKLILLK